MRALNSSVSSACLKIIDGVYLGSIKTALNKFKLKERGVTHVLCAAKDMDPFFPKDFKYLCFPIQDKVD